MNPIDARPKDEWVIAGRTVTMPCVVRDASLASLAFVAPLRSLRRLVAGPELEPAAVLPGRGLLTLTAVDYRDNDLGDYHEVSIATFVHERGQPPRPPFVGALRDLVAGRLPTCIHRLPVDQAFSCEAGRAIWGLPKTLDEIEWRYDGAQASCTWRADGAHVLTLVVTRGGGRTVPATASTTYTWIDGRLHTTAFETGATGVGVRPGGAVVVLGDHPIADELRALGLPRRALATTWMEHMHGSFDAPRPVTP